MDAFWVCIGTGFLISYVVGMAVGVMVGWGCGFKEGRPPYDNEGGHPDD